MVLNQTENSAKNIEHADSQWQLKQHESQTVKQQEVTFYTIGDARYFLGVVGLLNSLRLTGHEQKIVVLDCGLTPKQRDLLSPHCTLFQMPKELATNPTQFKAFPYLLQPQGTVVIIDSDILVVRSLQGLIDTGKQGNICVFPDLGINRYCQQWHEFFALSSPPRKQTYVNAGFIAFSTNYWPNLLERWWQACERTFAHTTISEGASHTSPCAAGDQDALNAILASEYPTEALALQSKYEEIGGRFLREVQIVNLQTLACKYCQNDITMLHSNGSPKPWEAKTVRSLVRRFAYVKLLRRLLTGTDVPIKVPTEDLPMVYRPGLLGQLFLFGLSILNAPYYVSHRGSLKASWAKKGW
jgi:hypothetical protein